MVELSPAQFQDASALFAGIDHNAALVYAVIEGNSRGRVFVDRAVSPTSAFLSHQGAFSYVGGCPDNEEFNRELEPLVFGKILPQTLEKELVLFAFSDAWRVKLDELLRPRSAIRIARKVFAFNPEKFQAHAGWRRLIPEGAAIRLVDRQTAEAYPELLQMLDPETRRFGTCLLLGNEIVSSCTAVCVGRGEAEIDIQTGEVHQGKGYATLAACAFIEECLARGLVPGWSCWPYREASYGLAVKLGFEPRPDVPAHYWAENM